MASRELVLSDGDKLLLETKEELEILKHRLTSYLSRHSFTISKHEKLAIHAMRDDLIHALILIEKTLKEP